MFIRANGRTFRKGSDDQQSIDECRTVEKRSYVGFVGVFVLDKTYFSLDWNGRVSKIKQGRQKLQRCVFVAFDELGRVDFDVFNLSNVVEELLQLVQTGTMGDVVNANYLSRHRGLQRNCNKSISHSTQHSRNLKRPT